VGELSATAAAAQQLMVGLTKLEGVQEGELERM